MGTTFFFYYCCFAVLFSATRWMIRTCRETKLARDATFELCDAGDALTNWVLEHPNSRGSETARELIRRKMRADLRWKETHPCAGKEVDLSKYATLLN